MSNDNTKMLYKKKFWILLTFSFLQIFLISGLSINVHSPTDIYYKNENILVNATFEDSNNIDTIWIEGGPIDSVFKILGEKSVKNIAFNQDFSEGSYTLTFSFNNTIGEIISKTIELTIDKTDPTISEETTTPLCSFEYQNLIVNVTIDDENIKNVKVSGNWEGSWKNYPVNCLNITNKKQECSYKISSNFLESGESFQWKFSSEDNAGNINEGLTNSYTVQHSTDLRIIPEMPDGLNNWYITEPQFILTNPNANQIYYKWDAGSFIEYDSQFNLENTPNDGNKTGGIFRLGWKSNTDCGMENEQTRIIYADFTSPIITNLMPEPNSENNPYRPLIQGYVKKIYSSTSEINVQSIVMKIDNIVVPTSIKTMANQNILVNHTLSQDLSIGEHTISIYARDNSGKEAINEWSFKVKPITPFELIINIPQNSKYPSKKVPVNISSTVNLSQLKYINLDNSSPRWTTLCRNCNSYGEKYRKTISANEGWNNLIIMGVDEFGIEKEENLKFYVDSKIPKIITTLPLKNKLSNGENFYIKYSERDLIGMSVSYGNNEMGFETTDVYNQCNESGLNVKCDLKLDLEKYENKEIFYWFNITDNLRSIKSKVVMIKVDTKKPIINVSSPEEQDYDSRRILFDIKLNEKVKRLELFDSAVPTRWKSLCMNCERTSKIQYLKTGPHDIIIKATDYAGNYEEQTISLLIN